MKPEEIKLGDWMRMFMGEVPPEFLIEIVIRSFFIYLLLITSMRLLGNRMAAQLSATELIALVSLAASIGVPLQAPDRGLLPAFVIAILVVVIGRLVAKWSFNSQPFERKIQGEIGTLIIDSEMDLKKMLHNRITVERLFAELRSSGIRHLGQVKRMYLEANGSFTILKEEHPNPGLSIIPAWDKDFLNQQKKTEILVCSNCGKRSEQNTKESNKCSNCHNTNWVPAIT